MALSRPRRWRLRARTLLRSVAPRAPAAPLSASFLAGGLPATTSLAALGSAPGALRVLLPAVLLGVLASFAFCPGSLALRGLLAEPTLEVLKDDMTQFTQNAFTTASLLFSLLLTDTLGLMLQRQERAYKAIFNEASQARALIEQLSFLGNVRGEGRAAAALMDDVEEHLKADLERLSGPLMPPERCGGADPLERLLFATSVGAPSDIGGSGRALRHARGERLAALRRRFPPGHFAILAALGLLVLGFFVLLGAGVASFEKPGEAALPGHILAMLAPLFGLLVSGISLAALVLRELGDPRAGLFGVQPVSREALEGLLEQLRRRRAALAAVDEQGWPRTEV